MPDFAAKIYFFVALALSFSFISTRHGLIPISTFKRQKIMRVIPQRKSIMRPMLNKYFGNAPLKI